LAELAAAKVAARDRRIAGAGREDAAAGVSAPPATAAAVVVRKERRVRTSDMHDSGAEGPGTHLN
jgi:hypothetical protein